MSEHATPVTPAAEVRVAPFAAEHIEIERLRQIAVDLSESLHRLSRELMKRWIEGAPSENVDVAWLRVEDGEDPAFTVLAVRYPSGPGQSWWAETGDWRGESYLRSIAGTITHWQPYVIPSKEIAR